MTDTMKNLCKECGQRIPENMLDTAGLMDVLLHGVPHREVYRSGTKWFVSYGGGQVPADIVKRLAQEGSIAPVYNNCPDDAYHIGKTIDVDATIAKRKDSGFKDSLVYVKD